MKAVATPLLGEPLEERGGDELTPVVRTEHLGLAVALEEALELGDDVASADRAIDPAAKRHPCVPSTTLRVRVARKSCDQTSLGAAAARFQGAFAAVPWAR